uniref:Tail assembly chaperone n=1 Tax=viral metagenome TaxID=1070528 RepID=A0A6M3L132_9ZZZZ
MTNILAEEKPKSLTLADGKEYAIPALNLTVLANMEATIGFGLGRLQEKMVDETASTLRLVIYALLKEADPKLELEEVGKLVTLDVMKDVSEVLSRVLSIAI